MCGYEYSPQCVCVCVCVCVRASVCVCPPLKLCCPAREDWCTGTSHCFQGHMASDSCGPDLQSCAQPLSLPLLCKTRRAKPSPPCEQTGGLEGTCTVLIAQ